MSRAPTPRFSFWLIAISAMMVVIFGILQYYPTEQQPQLAEENISSNIITQEKGPPTAPLVLVPLDPGTNLESVERDFYDSSDLHSVRVRSFIKELKGESFSEAIDNFYDDQVYFYPGIAYERHLAQQDIEYLLSNRRFLKIRSDLSEEDVKERRQILLRFANESIERSRETFDRIIAFYETPGSPKNSASMLGNKLAVSAASLLLAEHGDWDLAIEVIRKSQNVERTALRRIDEIPDDKIPDSVYAAVDLNGTIQDVVELNIRIHRLNQSGLALPPSTSVLTYREIRVVPWNAKRSSYDFNHVNKRFPIDESMGFEDFPVYNWPHELLNDIQGRRKLLDSLSIEGLKEKKP